MGVDMCFKSFGSLLVFYEWYKDERDGKDEQVQDDPSCYRKAKDDICYWITDEWYNFQSPMQKEIETACQLVLKKKDDILLLCLVIICSENRRTAE